MTGEFDAEIVASQDIWYVYLHMAAIINDCIDVRISKEEKELIKYAS